jgi:hypothetical protein
VLVDVAYSTINYKDALAVTGKAKICRTLPLVCGIDLAGTVRESSDRRFRAGDRVLVNGYGLSERHPGGYTQRQRLDPSWLVPAPAGLSLEETMAIGTAGYTAMLCVQALIDHGVLTTSGPVVVTGASGGVGSIAVMLLAKLGLRGRRLDRAGRRERRVAPQSRRARGHRSHRARALAEAARIRALGRRGGQRRRRDARDGARPDALLRHGDGLRARGRHAVPGQRRALHPARRDARGHRLGHGES